MITSATLRRVLRPTLWSLAVGLGATLLLSWGVPQVLLGFGFVQHSKWSEDAFWIDTACGGHYQRSTLWCSDWIIMKRIIFTGTPESQPYFRHNVPPTWVCTLDIAGLSGFQEVQTGATGWPLRAFASESWRRWAPGPGEEAEELRYNFVLTSTPRGRIMFPLRPIWAGLAADVAIFGGAWLILSLGASGVRRVIRHSRGRCPDCGYDRRGLPDAIAPCPECGHVPVPA